MPPARDAAVDAHNGRLHLGASERVAQSALSGSTSETAAPDRSAMPSSYLPSLPLHSAPLSRAEELEEQALLSERQAEQTVEEAAHLHLVTLSGVGRTDRIQRTYQQLVVRRVRPRRSRCVDALVQPM